MHRHGSAAVEQSSDDTTVSLGYGVRRVNHLLRLVLVLIASSLMMAATVHAREFPAETVVDCSGRVHVDGDADQSSGDADSGIPHHHGTCNASAMYVPNAGDFVSQARSAGLRLRSPTDLALPSQRVAPDLRPPNV
jgi:hypothetical protein